MIVETLEFGRCGACEKRRYTCPHCQRVFRLETPWDDALVPIHEAYCQHGQADRVKMLGEGEASLRDAWFAYRDGSISAENWIMIEATARREDVAWLLLYLAGYFGA